MNYVIIAVFWLLAIWATLQRGPALLYLLFGSVGFGAFAVIPTNLTFGLTFTATPIVLCLIIFRAFFAFPGPGFILSAALRFDRMGLLFLFWLVALVATIFFPRLFAGEVMVVPLRGVLSEPSPLRPTPQNVSQMVYVTISVLAVFAFARILRSRSDRQHALKALVFGGFVTGLTGMLDFATQFVPIEPLLAPFRTASYALATNVELLGAKRVVGLMPEASAFGGVSLGLLTLLIFFRRAIGDARVRNLYAPITIGLLLLCCWLAKSSATYLGLVVLLVAIVAEATLRAFSRGQTQQLYRQDLIGEFSVVIALLGLALLVVLVRPDIVESAYAVIDKMVLQKTESASFEERGMWRRVALEALWATGGLGVGLGSARTSSSLVAIFSGAGVIGGLLFYAYVLQTVLRPSKGLDWEGQFILGGFRFAFLPMFVVGLLVGDADFGAIQAFGFGLVTAVACYRQSMLAQQAAGRVDLHTVRGGRPNARRRSLPAPARLGGPPLGEPLSPGG